MKCLSCKHLTESFDPGGGEETGPGAGDSVSCALGRWYMSGTQCQISDLAHAVNQAETCKLHELGRHRSRE
jgi:hypothetical protein